MTDRFNCLTVVLDHDIREDDAQGMINAIKHIKGVISVKGNVTSFDTYAAESRARHEWVTKLLNIIKETP